ncbi:MAG: sulfatase-like hydrolase/transferase [Acidobacteriota bacterium]
MDSRRNHPAPLFLASAAMACLLALHCGPADSHQRIILITIDSLRPDRMAPYGASTSVMPHLDALASQSVVFENAVTPSPVTFPALAGLMTGRPPSAVGALDNEHSLLSTRHPRLAPLLLKEGWSTGAFLNAVFLDQDSGILEGFVHAFNPTGATPVVPSSAEALFQNAVEFLNRYRKIPAFAWIHLHDSAFPYTGRGVFGRGDQRYDASLSSIDRALGRFLDRLREKGLFTSSTILVAGDHGEALGEESERTHGVFLNASTLHVPLLMHLPERTSSRRVSSPVTLLDLGPTILDLARVPPLPAGGPLDGRSLRPLLERAAAPGQAGASFPAERPLYSETFVPFFDYLWPPRRQIRRGATAYATEAQAGIPFPPWPELPLDQARAAGLGEQQTFLESVGRVMDALATSQLEEAARMVTGLSRLNPDAPITTSLLAAVQRARGQLEEALAALEARAGSPPVSAEIWGALARLEKDLGRPAASAWEKAARAAPTRPGFRIQQAEALLAAGQNKQAIQAARLAAASDLDSATLSAALGRILLLAGRAKDAMRMLATAVVQSPGSSFFHRQLAFASLAAGEKEGALKMLREARTIDPLNRSIEADIGDVYATTGDFRAARDAYRKSLPPNIHEPEATLSVAESFLRVGSLEKAARLVEEVLGQHPDNPRGHYIRGQIAMRREHPEQAQDDFLKALQDGGEQATIYYGLARVALMQSDETAALSYLRKVFAMDDPVLRSALRVDGLLHSLDATSTLRVEIDRYLAGGSPAKGNVP